MNQYKKDAGINEEDMKQNAVKYEDHMKQLQEQGRTLLPLGEGILIWDETKVSILKPIYRYLY